MSSNKTKIRFKAKKFIGNGQIDIQRKWIWAKWLKSRLDCNSRPTWNLEWGLFRFLSQYKSLHPKE
jgi:hypothetical protein